MLETLLQSWQPDRQLLVFLGDLVDRGPDSYGVVQIARRLRDKYGAVVLGGNHESYFLDFLDHPEDKYFSQWKSDESIINECEEAAMSVSISYYSNGGDKTINSFYDSNYAYLYSPSHHAAYIKNHFADEIAFLRDLPDHLEWKNYVCVHAGVNLAYVDWRKTEAWEYRSIRTFFHKMKNETGKTFIFGHHPTRYLNDDKRDDIWVSSCETKIGIDGAAVFGGKLHGLEVGKNGIFVNSVDKTGSLERKAVRANI